MPESEDLVSSGSSYRLWAREVLYLKFCFEALVPRQMEKTNKQINKTTGLLAQRNGQ